MPLKIWNPGDVLSATDLNNNFADCLRFRGEWSNLTAYLTNEVVTLDGDLYRSILAGTNHSPDSSPSYWAPWSVGSGGSGVPAGGTTGQILAKTSNADGDADWIDAPTGGAPGTPGAPGSVWYAGTGTPAGGTGINGDFYLRSTGDVYQKAAGAWGLIFSIKGAPGSPGTPGTPGANGNTLLNGTTAPGSGVGVDGDFYINTSNATIYGPKTSGAWGAGTSLVGADGNDGIFTAIASQAEAEAGTDNVKGMTALRVAQAIAALAPSSGGGGGGSVAFSGARVYKTSGQAISSGTWTPLTFDAEEYDTDSYHSTSSNTDRLTVPVSGYYRVTANIGFNSSGSEGSRWVRLRKNGTSEIAAHNARPLQDGYGNIIAVACEAYLSAGDYITCDVACYGGSITTGVGDWGPSFSISRIAVGSTASGLPITQGETDSYLLKENTGTTVYNAINSKSSTISGSGTFSWSTLGSRVAASFSGGKYAKLPLCSRPIKNARQFTFSALIKIPSLTATGNDNYLLTGSSLAHLAIYVTQTGKLGLYLSDTGNQTVESSTGAIVANTTHHVAVTHDGVNIYLYVDGTQVATATATQQLSVLVDDDGFNLGEYRDGQTGIYYFQGLIACARIWARALRASEISTLHTTPDAGLT